MRKRPWTLLVCVYALATLLGITAYAGGLMLALVLFCCLVVVGLWAVVLFFLVGKAVREE